MAPLSGAAKAAVEDFFTGRQTGHTSLTPRRARGDGCLLRHKKGLTDSELPTARPTAPELVLEWRAEWRDYARSAGLADEADINNVGRWIAEEAPAVEGGLRAGKTQESHINNRSYRTRLAGWLA